MDISFENRTDRNYRFLRRAFRSAGDAIVILELDGNIQYCNPAFSKLTGYAKEEVIGKNPRILKSGLHPKKYYKRMWDTVTNGDIWFGEIKNRRKDGNLYTAQLTAAPIFDRNHNIEGYIGIQHDITKQKRAEQNLKESLRIQENLNSLFQLSLQQEPLEIILEKALGTLCSASFMPFTPKGGIFLVESGALRLKVHRNLPPVLQNMCSKVLYGQCLCGRAAQEKMLQFSSNIDQRHDNRYPGIKPHGHYAVPILSKDVLLGVIIVYLDPDHQKADNEIIFLKSVAGAMASIIENRRMEEERERALTEARNANRVKDLFLANISHEIRTPLNGIIGFMQLIEEKTRHLMNEGEQQFFDFIRTSGDRLLHTVHEILDISQIEAGTFQRKATDVDLVKFIRDILLEYRPLAENKNLRITFDTDLEQAPIQADFQSLRQAVGNLLDNAIKFTKEGGIDLSLTVEDEFYIVKIADTGVGISSKYLGKLFEPFSQESEGYTKDFQGIGLGMAIAKRYLDTNNVQIQVTSKKEVGTTITLRFHRVPE